MRPQQLLFGLRAALGTLQQLLKSQQHVLACVCMCAQRLAEHMCLPASRLLSVVLCVPRVERCNPIHKVRHRLRPLHSPSRHQFHSRHFHFYETKLGIELLGQPDSIQAQTTHAMPTIPAGQIMGRLHYDGRRPTPQTVQATRKFDLLLMPAMQQIDGCTRHPDRLWYPCALASPSKNVSRMLYSFMTCSNGRQIRAHQLC